MKPAEADKIIKIGKNVTVYSEHFHERFTRTFIKRDRWNIVSSRGEIFDRGDLKIEKIHEMSELEELQKAFPDLFKTE